MNGIGQFRHLIGLQARDRLLNHEGGTCQCGIRLRKPRFQNSASDMPLADDDLTLCVNGSRSSQHKFRLDDVL